MKTVVRGIQIPEEDKFRNTWRIRGIDRVSSCCSLSKSLIHKKNTADNTHRIMEDKYYTGNFKKKN